LLSNLFTDKGRFSLYFIPKKVVRKKTYLLNFHLKVLLEAGEDFITINETVGADGKPDIHFKMDRNKLLTVGLPAIGKFLTKLQVKKT
jgi:hypothetical protein